MTIGVKRRSARLASTLLLAALLSIALVACGEETGSGIATGSEVTVTAPTSVAPEVVDPTSSAPEIAEPTSVAPEVVPPTPADPEDAGLIYAQCMRDNGVPEFSDPGAGGEATLGHEVRMDPRFGLAMEACSALAPGAEYRDIGDPAYVEQVREFSQCIRENGLPDFPDPDAEGKLSGIGHSIRTNPRYGAATEICRIFLPGEAVPPGIAGH
ncbi:MAG: hypothetical protein HQ478_05230 [Chloroflexi bacterium]|nr:hypothetical protein [Chloroflexota bacterium]